MAKPNEKLAEALKVLKKLQDKHNGVIDSNDLKEAHRSILVEEGFLHPVMKGWYVCSNPKDGRGDSTSWYASFWSFLSGYMSKRFGKRYCLNVEASALLHTHSTIIPRQITVIIKEGGTSTLNLPHDTSVLIYTDEKNVPKNRIEVNGLQAIPLPEVLCRLGPQFFKNNPREAEIALNLIRDPGELLTILLAGGGVPAAAGRLAGALRFMGRGTDADRIIATMKRAKHNVREANPFETSVPTLGNSRERSPYAMRIQSMWVGWRDDILSVFPPAPGLPKFPESYLSDVEERYVADAYNSLSIEGYQVNDELIERVAKGNWNPDGETKDESDRDALAARGYYQAFQAIKISLAEILSGKNPGEVARSAHHQWYGELFAPSVTAGIVESHQLAGYRNGPVYIRNSKHAPLPRDALADSMEALFNLIAQEPEPAIRAVLGHHLFVFIHPYFDGNGRVGRFLMNAMLASGGYPWTIVRMKSRDQYMHALEAASVGGDIKPFANFIAFEMRSDTSAKITS
ncbi:MAG TPA: Fic family protein [Gallionella sp.]|nr:Fic family protein [Gallionella sp.]